MIKNDTSNSEQFQVLDMGFTYHTRTDEPSSTIPDKFYSSLKYQTKISFTCFCAEPLEMVMCKIQVVDEDGEEILKDREPILGGKSSVALQPLSKYEQQRHQLLYGPISSTRNRDSDKIKTLCTNTKIQITDVSYHHSRRNFCLQLSFSVPFNNFSSSVLVVRSTPFQVYARRNNYKQKKGIINKLNKKRIRESEQEEEEFVDILSREENGVEAKRTKLTDEDSMEQPLLYDLNESYVRALVNFSNNIDLSDGFW